MRRLTTEEIVATKPMLEEFSHWPRTPIYVLLDNVRSLMNVGLIFRLCDAIRAEKLFLTGITGHPPEPKINKTAIRTVDYVPWEYRPDPAETVDELKGRGVQIVAVEQTDESIPYRRAPYRFPTCLVFGHQREGVTAPVLDLADFAVEIPLFGIGNSLNVAMALAIVGYELTAHLERQGLVHSQTVIDALRQPKAA